MSNVLIVFEQIKVTVPNIRTLKDLAYYAWENLNPRTFSIGMSSFLGNKTWTMSGHGKAQYWYTYNNCIASGELVDFLKMLGTSHKDATSMRDHLINQGFYKIVFNLEDNRVKGRPSLYLLRFLG